MAAEVRAGDGARTCARSSTRCRATPAATSRKLAEPGAPDRRQHRRPDRPPPRALLRRRPTGATGSTSTTWPTCSWPTSTDGIDALDYSGPVVRRTDHRAGVIKVAGSDGGPSPRDRRVFEAAADGASRGPGAPILTHCEGGTGALEQVGAPGRLRRRPAHVVLSHVDKVVDRGYHREMLATGAFVEYDGSFRWGDEPNGTLQLLGWMAEDGLLDRVVLGMDAARQGYYRVYGGAPGLAWLLDGFTALMEAAGLDATVRHAAVRRQSGPGIRLRDADGGERDDRRSCARASSGSHARPSWFVVGHRGRGARRVRPGRSRGDARRRGRPRAARPGGGRHRRRERRRDAPRRLLHGRVLPAPDRRPGAARRPAAGRRRPRPAAPLRGARADRRARRPGRRGRVPVRGARARRDR